ncbi:heat shock protein HspQ [Coraliomargarita sp. W4R72]
MIGLTDMDGGAAPGTYYDLGVVVIHQIYGYRGVIVAIDQRCMAGDTWYQSNKTQPPREQPWYHVLVHDSGGLSTYVAQSNLAEDTSGRPVSHPRIDSYFADFKEGRYQLKQNHTSGGYDG